MAKESEPPRCPVAHDAAEPGCPVPTGTPHPPISWTEGAIEQQPRAASARR